MPRCLIAFALAVLLLCASAAALSVDAPGNIVLYDESKPVSVSITNDGDSAGQYTVEFLGPGDAVISPASGSIAAGATKAVSLELQPNEGLTGQNYESTLVVELGEEKAVKRISLFFKGEKEEEAEAEPMQGLSFDWAATGFASFFSAENFSGLFGGEGLGGWLNAENAAGLFSVENAVNVFLVFIAAILLIAFIARLVKRLEAARK